MFGLGIVVAVLAERPLDSTRVGEGRQSQASQSQTLHGSRHAQRRPEHK